MSTDLLNQLEAYYTEIEVTHHDVTPDRVADLVERVREVPAPRSIPLQEKPRVWVPLAAATALIVLIAVVPVVFRILADDEPPTTDPTPTTTVAPTTTSTPETAPPTSAVGSGPTPVSGMLSATDAGWTWTELRRPSGLPGFARGYRVRSGAIVRFDPGWICTDGQSVFEANAGSSADGSGCSGLIEKPVATVEVSVDGIEWGPTTSPPAPPSWVMHHYHNGAGGYLYILYGDLRGDSYQWYGTADGVEWFEAFNDGEELWSPSASFPTEAGAVVVLSEPKDYGGGLRDVRFLVSTDGGETYFDDIVPSELTGGVSLLGAVDGGIEALVWSDVESDGIAYADPIVWRSLDGVEWVELGVAIGLPTLDTPRDVVSYPDGSRKELDPRPGTIVDLPLTMWQFDNGQRIAWFDVSDRPSGFYLSDDGLSWNAISTGSFLALADMPPIGIADGWLTVAFGKRVLTTRDGAMWYRVLGPEGMLLDQYFVDNVGVLALDSVPSGDGSRRADHVYRAIPPG